MFTISIDQFEGPLDLMLFLIKDKKLDLFDLDVSQLIHQYQSYLYEMKENQFEIATEYISELAGLIEYKSKKLIPSAKAEFDHESEEQPMNIVDRLLAYEQAKKISIQLKDRYEKRMQLLSKAPSGFETHHQQLKQQNPSDLIKAFEKVMARLRLSNPYELKTTNKELSVSERVNQLRKDISRYKAEFTLEELLFKYKDIQEMIVTFLAILDMIRLHELSFTIEQDIVYLQRRVHE